MDLIVFGDDWQAHPSTTQHLINHLPEADRILWFNSIGMRSPDLSLRDAKRILRKVKNMFQLSKKPTEATDHRLLEVVQPRILPWHNNRLVRGWNKRSLCKTLTALKLKYQLDNPVVLTSNPVVTEYLPDWLAGHVHYLRLDDYALFGGVDQQLAMASERYTFNHVRHVFYTARQLKPISSQSSYLPQGVNVQNFRVNKFPEGNKTLGYFGLIEKSRFDFDLIYKVATEHPDWTLEFIGDVTYCPDRVRQCPNVILRDKVAFEELSAATRHWHAAWIPYEVSPLTNAINPLKVREYLALGLAVVSSKMPEVMALDEQIYLYDSNRDFKEIFMAIIQTENYQVKKRRAQAIKTHSWAYRAQQLRAVIAS